MMKPLPFSRTCIHAEVNCFLHAGKRNALRINCKNMKWSNHRFLTFVIWINDHGRETLKTNLLSGTSRKTFRKME